MPLLDMPGIVQSPQVDTGALDYLNHANNINTQSDSLSSVSNGNLANSDYAWAYYWAQYNSAQAAAAAALQQAENQKNRDFYKDMDATKYQRLVEDMKKAGLNIGAIGNGVSTSVSPVSGSSVAQYATANPDRVVTQETLRGNYGIMKEVVRGLFNVVDHAVSPINIIKK